MEEYLKKKKEKKCKILMGSHPIFCHLKKGLTCWLKNIYIYLKKIKKSSGIYSTSLFSIEYWPTWILKSGGRSGGSQVLSIWEPPLYWWEQLLGNWKITQSGNKKTVERTIPFYHSLILRHIIMIRRLIYYHYILTREDEELIKRIYQKQIQLNVIGSLY